MDLTRASTRRLPRALAAPPEPPKAPPAVAPFASPRNFEAHDLGSSRYFEFSQGALSQHPGTRAHERGFGLPLDASTEQFDAHKGASGPHEHRTRETLSLHSQASTQALAGMSSFVYNWSRTAKLHDQQVKTLWHDMLRYLQPCAHLDPLVAGAYLGIREAAAGEGEHASWIPDHSPEAYIGNNLAAGVKRQSPGSRPRPPSSPEGHFDNSSLPAGEKARSKAQAQGLSNGSKQPRVAGRKHFAGTTIHTFVADIRTRTLGYSCQVVMSGGDKYIDRVLIKEVDEEGWAYCNGLNPKDELIRVNGVKVQNMDMQNFREAMAKRPVKLEFERLNDNLEEMIQEEDAALRIQSLFRGRAARNEVNDMRTEVIAQKEDLDTSRNNEIDYVDKRHAYYEHKRRRMEEQEQMKAQRARENAHEKKVPILALSQKMNDAGGEEPFDIANIVGKVLFADEGVHNPSLGPGTDAEWEEHLWEQRRLKRTAEKQQHTAKLDRPNSMVVGALVAGAEDGSLLELVELLRKDRQQKAYAEQILPSQVNGRSDTKRQRFPYFVPEEEERESKKEAEGQIKTAADLELKNVEGLRGARDDKAWEMRRLAKATLDQAFEEEGKKLVHQKSEEWEMRRLKKATFDQALEDELETSRNERHKQLLITEKERKDQQKRIVRAAEQMVEHVADDKLLGDLLGVESDYVRLLRAEISRDNPAIFCVECGERCEPFDLHGDPFDHQLYCEPCFTAYYGFEPGGVEEQKFVERIREEASMRIQSVFRGNIDREEALRRLAEKERVIQTKIATQGNSKEAAVGESTKNDAEGKVSAVERTKQRAAEEKTELISKEAAERKVAADTKSERDLASSRAQIAKAEADAKAAAENKAAIEAAKKAAVEMSKAREPVAKVAADTATVEVAANTAAGENANMVEDTGAAIAKKPQAIAKKVAKEESDSKEAIRADEEALATKVLAKKATDEPNSKTAREEDVKAPSKEFVKEAATNKVASEAPAKKVAEEKVSGTPKVAEEGIAKKPIREKTVVAKKSETAPKKSPEETAAKNAGAAAQKATGDEAIAATKATEEASTVKAAGEKAAAKQAADEDATNNAKEQAAAKEPVGDKVAAASKAVKDAGEKNAAEERSPTKNAAEEAVANKANEETAAKNAGAAAKKATGDEAIAATKATEEASTVKAAVEKAVAKKAVDEDATNNAKEQAATKEPVGDKVAAASKAAKDAGAKKAAEERSPTKNAAEEAVANKAIEETVAKKAAEEAAARKAIEEAAAMKAAEEAAAKRAAEEAAANKAAEEVAARKAIEEAAAKIAAKEAAAKKAAEEAAAKKAAEEAAVKKAIEEAAAKKAAEEAAARKAIEEVAAKKAAEEAAAKKAAEEVAAKKAAEEAAARKAIEEAAAKKAAEEAAKKAAEEAAAKKVADEEAAAKKVVDDAAIKAGYKNFDEWKAAMEAEAAKRAPKKDGEKLHTPNEAKEKAETIPNAIAESAKKEDPAWKVARLAALAKQQAKKEPASSSSSSSNSSSRKSESPSQSSSDESLTSAFERKKVKPNPKAKPKEKEHSDSEDSESSLLLQNNKNVNARIHILSQPFPRSQGGNKQR